MPAPARMMTPSVTGSTLKCFSFNGSVFSTTACAGGVAGGGAGGAAVDDGAGDCARATAGASARTTSGASGRGLHPP